MAKDIKIINLEFYQGLTDNEKEIFLAHRNSMLIIFPKNDETKEYDDDVISIIEESSKVFVTLFPEIIKNPPPPLPPTPAI